MTAGPLHHSAWARIVLVELELDMSPGAAHLVDALAHYANEQGEVWPTVETLMTRMRRGRRFVEQARAELVRLGLLIPVSGQSGGRRRDGSGVRSRYRLAIPNPAPSCGVVAPQVVPNPAPRCAQPRTVVRGQVPVKTHCETSTRQRPPGRDVAVAAMIDPNVRAGPPFDPAAVWRAGLAEQLAATATPLAVLTTGALALGLDPVAEYERWRTAPAGGGP